MLPLLALFDILARPLARSVLTSLRADSGLYFSYVFVQIEPCRALCFTVVAFHLEPTLPHFGETLNLGRLCFVGRSSLRPSHLLCKVVTCVCAFCVPSLSAAHLRFGIVTPYGVPCVSTS